MRAFGAHESSIRHATSLSEQTERRLPIARRNCRLRGGTAECAEELGKLITSKHGAPAERERSRCEAEAAAGAGRWPNPSIGRKPVEITGVFEI